MNQQIKDQVKSVLINFPETRNSDIALTIKVWQQFYQVGEQVSVRQLYDLPREDHIKRIRARFCEQHEVFAFPTDIKVVKARKIKEEEWRKVLNLLPSAV